MSALEDEEEDEMQQRDIPVPETLTRELFLQWRNARRGSANPERMNNPLWEWLIESRWSAFWINDHFKASSPFEAGPGWCFNRFGRSTTQLPDGRTVLIAGEHEDYYDPDFFIYNDVVVRHPDGGLEIYGYPPEVFPPTDFHSATLVGDRIVLIGSLGYPKERQAGDPRVATLDLNTFAISQVKTTGTSPGWIYEHTAVLSESGDSIVVRGGRVFRPGEDAVDLENIDEWRLHLADWRWERLTQRQWQQWELRREDRKSIHLFYIKQALWSRSVGWDKNMQEYVGRIEEMCGRAPDLDLAATLFQPSVDHESVPEVEGEHRVRRLRIGDVVVRYVDAMSCIEMTVEGDLPQEIIEELKADLRVKLATLENAACEWRKLG